MHSNIFLLFIFLIGFVNSACPPPPAERSVEAKLREKVFCNYKKTVRPTKNYANATNVLILLHPFRIFMSHYSDTLSVHGSFFYTWKDPYLSWNPAEFEGIEYLIRSNEMWVPDIFVESATGSQKLLNPYSIISYRGAVLGISSINIYSHCTSDLTKFPFDTQNCSFSISSQGYLGKYVNLLLFDPWYGIDMEKFIPNKIWDVVDYSAIQSERNFSLKGEDDTDGYPYITYSFVLQRRSSKYQQILILPCIGLAFITLLTFLMHSMYYSRIILCCVSIIGDILYITFLAFWFPATGSTTPVIVTYFRDSLLISILALLAGILVHHISSKTTSPHPWITSLIIKLDSSILGNIFLSETPSKEDDTIELVEGQKQNKLKDWSNFAFFIDRALLIICILLYIILSICYIP